jgi:hypothetical protein
MSSYSLVESLPFPNKDRVFQNAVKPMAEQVVTVDKLYGYDALTHGNQPSNDSGYFNFHSGYGNNKMKIGYDNACAHGIVKRDILGRVTIIDPSEGPKSQSCGCTKYKKRNCTGTMGHIPCGQSTLNSPKCPKHNSLCCYSGDMCSPRKIGESGTCIAGQPYRDPNHPTSVRPRPHTYTPVKPKFGPR